MAIYMPPISRKKRVIERYNPDTFRVISNDAEETHQKIDYIEDNKPSEWRRQWLQNDGLALPNIRTKKTEVLPHSAPDYRIHKPHPGSCGFLRHNVRVLNEPICSVYTEDTKDEQDHWWPSRISNEPLQVPPRTVDTIYRLDFLDQERKQSPFGATRHTSNPNSEPALGTVPVNFLRQKDGSQRFFKEKKSYEHQYNSRIDPNYPTRGKRHGAFVWDPISAEKTKKLIDHYHVYSSEEGTCRQEASEAERLANDAAKQLENNFNESAHCQYEATTVQVEPTQVQTEPEQVQACPGSAKGSPSHSGNCSPKQPLSRKNSTSKPASDVNVQSTFHEQNSDNCMTDASI